MNYRPYLIEGETRPGRWLITCDHAAPTVPDAISGGDLGLPPEDMNRHISYDPGAAGVSRALGERLDAPVLLGNFSRLVIDPNRGEDDPTLLMQVYDGTLIPANRHAGAAERERRLNLCHRPYHSAYEKLAARPASIIAAVHSFTPQLRGRAPRPWQIGILHGGDERLSRPMIDLLRSETDLTVGDNEPYTGFLPGDSIDRHALQHGRPNILIELRNDLIANPEQQQEWADLLVPLLERVLAQAQL